MNKQRPVTDKNLESKIIMDQQQIKKAKTCFELSCIKHSYKHFAITLVIRDFSLLKCWFFFLRFLSIAFEMTLVSIITTYHKKIIAPAVMPLKIKIWKSICLLIKWFIPEIAKNMTKILACIVSIKIRKILGINISF